MDDKDKNELEAMVVGFLQQSLKDNPRGFTLQEFERYFPERCEEPRDWYKRYKKRSTLEALECIKNTIQVTVRGGSTCISLNLSSDKVDTHLVDLITNQKASTKKKRGFTRPSSRALSSYSLNRQYQSHHTHGNYRSRLNHDQHYRDESQFIKRSSPPVVAPAFKPSQYRASADPRLRGTTTASSTSPSTNSSSATAPMVLPQVKPSSFTSSVPAKPVVAAIASQRQLSVPNSQNIQRITSLKTAEDSSLKPVKARSKEEEQDLTIKKSYLRQRILSLLTRKFSEIKLLHLSALYQLEYCESIDPATYGHQNLTNLMQDPELSAHISVNYKAPFVTVSAKSRAPSNGKENNNDEEINNACSLGGDSNHLVDESNTISANKSKYDAIDPFNVRTMLHNLEPIGAVKEPPLQFNDIDEVVKYKTLRIIFKSPNMTMKLDDWTKRFVQESRLRPDIRGYGCRTLLEFFKLLATDLPIRIILNKEEEWIAVADINLLSEWVHHRVSEGYFRAVTSIEVRYEMIAFPNDLYTYADAKALISQKYHPIYILSVKRSDSIWVQLRTAEGIEKHLCIDDFMTAYEDYTTKTPLKLPASFIKPGFPCAVYDSSQQRWCRALILKAPEIIDKNYDVTALLVDYAIARKYTIKQIHPLMKPHLKPPVGPIFSKVFGITNEDDLNTQKRTKMVLQEYTNPYVTLACIFLKVIPSNEPAYLPSDCLEVTLVDTRSGKDCNLGEDINHSIEVAEHSK